MQMPPSRQNLNLYLLLGFLLTLEFAIIYGGTNWFNSDREEYFRLYFDWELVTPFTPAMILVYLSLQLLFLLPLLHCDRSGLLLLAKRMAVAILVAGVIFLLIPTQLGFSREGTDSSYAVFYEMLYTLDRTHNLFPSLHVTLATLVIAGLVRQLSTHLLGLYIGWLFLLFVSVLLVHQHHLADIVGGIVLAWLVVRYLPDSGGQDSLQISGSGR